MRLFSALFWGIFLLASGLVILLNIVLRMQINTGRLIFGLFILLIGISLLTTNFGWNKFSFNDENTIAFSSDAEINPKCGNEYNVIFGSSHYDLTKMEPGSNVKIHCIFSSCTVKLPSGAVKVIANSGFGNIHMPNGSVTFGDRIYETPGDMKVTVEITCAFGSVAVNE